MLFLLLVFIRIYKKMSNNGKLSLFLINRDLVLNNDSVSCLHAVIAVDPEEIKNKKVRRKVAPRSHLTIVKSTAQRFLPGADSSLQKTPYFKKMRINKEEEEEERLVRFEENRRTSFLALVPIVKTRVGYKKNWEFNAALVAVPAVSTNSFSE